MSGSEFLINNIEASYVRVMQNPDPVQKEYALKILEQVSITVVMPEDANIPNIPMVMKKIDEYRPEGYSVPVTLLRPFEIREFVQQEYEKMGLSKPDA